MAMGRALHAIALDPWAAWAQRVDAVGPDHFFGPGGSNFLDRLAWMMAIPPRMPDKNHEVDLGDPRDFVEELRHYAEDNLAKEILDQKRTMFDQDDDEDCDPRWMYLKGTSEQSRLDFWHWFDVITDDLGCDFMSSMAFVHLFRTAPAEAPHGYMEACRVLAHILKDKSKGPDDPGHGPGLDGKQDWSRFMEVACKEAMECMEAPDAQGKGLGISCGVPPPTSRTCRTWWLIVVLWFLAVPQGQGQGLEVIMHDMVITQGMPFIVD